MAKSPETRKDELLAAAKQLFWEQGVDQTAVSDIVKKAGVAQGTFYNYFKSKDEIFAAVLEFEAEHIFLEIQSIANRDDINANEKLTLITQQDFLLNREDDPLFYTLHDPRYAYAHQKYLIDRIIKLKPIYAKLIRQGVEEKLFDTPYPEQAALYLLTVTKFIFDPAFFTYSLDEMLMMANALQNFNERVIGLKVHTPLPALMEQGIKNYYKGDNNEDHI